MAPRKYFLDWLRVLAFGALILFHVGMLYVTWTYNIKSPRLVPAIEPAMNALGAFRLALLFFVSGVASRFLIGRLGPRLFARDRLRRLLPVILFGMAVVIPPQTYVELVSKGVTSQDYLSFWWTQYLAADQTLVRPLHKTMPTWDHLWFIVYLFFYTLLFALVFALTHWRSTGAARRWQLPLPVLLLGPALLLAAANLLIVTRFPMTEALVNDWGAHLKWFGMFWIGVVCARDDRFWDWARRHRARLALAALVLVTVQTLIHTYENPWYQIVYGFYAWAAICALVGYAAQYLNKPSALLTHLNEAVLPVYVLHQPILLIAAYFIFPLHWPLAAEALTLAAITGFGSLAIYELLIRPFRIPRILFGLKPA